MKWHRRLGQPEHVAKCLLHISAILAKLKRNKEALGSLKRVLDMVEGEELEVRWRVGDGGVVKRVLDMVEGDGGRVAESGVI